MNQTEQALNLFTNQVARIPGVIKTCRYRVGKSDEEGVLVVVKDLFSPITHDVIQAQELVYDAMPGIRFSLEIKDIDTI